MRRLATVQQISELRPIEGADAIEVARINGWDVVVKKGDFKTDEMVVFCEVDSFLPIQPEYEFLRKSSYKKMSDGTEGFRLRTIRLRGQLSQGLLINYQTLISKLPPDENGHVDLPDMGEDVTEIMGIIKYEPPVPACLAGQVKGNFPGFLHKTDEERCCDQNTMIETVDGLKTIKEICELKYSGRIKSYNHDLERVEYRNILNWSIMTRKINSWIKIKTKSGKELIVTDNHKVFIENDECYRESKYLKIGDKLNISKKD